MYNVIAFVGFKTSGKNTAAEALYPYGYVPVSFADALKDSLAAIFCWERGLLEGITPESRAWRERIDPWWADKLSIPHFTPRWAMVNVGTDVMRRYFHNDLWVFNVERRISSMASVALTDARFPNEIALAHRYGGRVIRIQREVEPDWMDLAIAANRSSSHARELLHKRGIHESEYAWIGGDIDDVIYNDGTIVDLHTKVLLAATPTDEARRVKHLTSENMSPSF